jgi:hypothetical protein
VLKLVTIITFQEYEQKKSTEVLGGYQRIILKQVLMKTAGWYGVDSAQYKFYAA